MSTKIKRYLGVLIRTRFGLLLPKAGLINYAKHYFVKRKPEETQANPRLCAKPLSFGNG